MNNEHQDQRTTPAAQWRADGEPDPHGKRYDCERAALCMGNLTDDELANEAFLNYDARPNIQDIIDGKAHMPIAYMTAVKDRIRWLSRRLEEATAAPKAELSKDAIDYPRDVFSSLILGNSPYAFYLFQWVPYQTEAKRWRLKMCHDVKTFDGREAIGIWPNGSRCGPFKDEEVEFIRISRKQFGDEYKDPRGEL